MTMRTDNQTQGIVMAHLSWDRHTELAAVARDAKLPADITKYALEDLRQRHMVEELNNTWIKVVP